MTFSDVFLPVPFLASPFDLHRLIPLKSVIPLWLDQKRLPSFDT